MKSLQKIIKTKLLYRIQRKRCFWCERRLRLPRRKETDSRPDRATLDHIVPRSKGGGNRLENLVVACIPCNSRRSATLTHPCGGHLLEVDKMLDERRQTLRAMGHLT